MSASGHAAPSRDSGSGRKRAAKRHKMSAEELDPGSSAPAPLCCWRSFGIRGLATRSAIYVMYGRNVIYARSVIYAQASMNARNEPTSSRLLLFRELAWKVPTQPGQPVWQNARAIPRGGERGPQQEQSQ